MPGVGEGHLTTTRQPRNSMGPGQKTLADCTGMESSPTEIWQGLPKSGTDTRMLSQAESDKGLLPGTQGTPDGRCQGAGDRRRRAVWTEGDAGRATIVCGRSVLSVSSCAPAPAKPRSRQVAQHT